MVPPPLKSCLTCTSCINSYHICFEKLNLLNSFNNSCNTFFLLLST